MLEPRLHYKLLVEHSQCTGAIIVVQTTVYPEIFMVCKFHGFHG